MDPTARTDSPVTGAPPATPALPAELLTFPPMIDGELTRFVLDQQGVAYRERPHIAIVANLIALARAHTINLPVLSNTLSGAGPAITGARPIIDWSEARCAPAQRLLPAGPTQAATVERLWHRANGDLATATAAFAYFHLLPHREIMVMPLSRGAPGWEVFATKLAYPLFRGFIGKVLGLSAAKAAAALATIRAVFAECDALLADQREFLTGDRLTLADIAMATAAAPLLLPEGYGAPIPPLAQMPPALQALNAELRRTRMAGFVQAVYRQRPAQTDTRAVDATR